MDKHLQRLLRSAKSIRLKLPYSIEEIKNNLETLMENSEINSGYIYLQMTRGIAERNHLFPQNTEATLVAYTTPYERPVENMNNGVKAHLTKDIRWERCDIKSINLLANVLAKQEAVDHGCYESILHRNGFVTEGSSTNMFIVQDNVIYTHPANYFILNGITRMEVIKMAKLNGLAIREEAFTVDDLFQAEEVFLTRRNAELKPMVQFVDTFMGMGKQGLVTQKLIE